VKLNVKRKQHSSIFSGNSTPSPVMDIHEFESILFEIVFGRPITGERSISADIPDSVSMAVKPELYPASGTGSAFSDILGILNENNFEIDDGVD
jgi:hypothetical protein